MNESKNEWWTNNTRTFQAIFFIENNHKWKCFFRRNEKLFAEFVCFRNLIYCLPIAQNVVFSAALNISTFLSPTECKAIEEEAQCCSLSLKSFNNDNKWYIYKEKTFPEKGISCEIPRAVLKSSMTREFCVGIPKRKRRTGELIWLSFSRDIRIYCLTLCPHGTMRDFYTMGGWKVKKMKFLLN